MKTITTNISGLASSLFLNVGLTQLAQKLDPVSDRPTALSRESHGPAYTAPCSRMVKPRHGS